MYWRRKRKWRDMGKNMKRIKIFLMLGCFICGICFVGCGKTEKEEPVVTGKTAQLTFITIGKGDAFLIRTPGDTYYLCDTGKKEDYPQIKRVLEKKQVTELKGIFLSHGHKDHAGNLKKLIKEYPVEKIYISRKDEASYEKNEIQESAEAGQVLVEYLEGGEVLELEGMKAAVWIPQRCDYRNANNNSVVLRFEYGQNSFLLTGDMEYGEEAAYLQSGEVQKTDILKLGHHGENDATSAAFLKKVKPAYGLITGNEEENPESVNPEIEARLDAFDVECFFSEGEQLAWEFILDGEQIRVEPLRE